MKTTRLVAMLAMAGASLFAGQSAAPQKATVNVCMENAPYILIGVRPLASAMFASIGVRIAWHELDSCPAEVGAIQVRLSHDAPSIRNSASEAELRMLGASWDRRTCMAPTSAGHESSSCQAILTPMLANIAEANGRTPIRMYGAFSIQTFTVAFCGAALCPAKRLAPAIANMATKRVVFISCSTSTATGGRGRENRPRS